MAWIEIGDLPPKSNWSFLAGFLGVDIINHGIESPGIWGPYVGPLDLKLPFLMLGRGTRGSSVSGLVSATKPHLRTIGHTGVGVCLRAS